MEAQSPLLPPFQRIAVAIAFSPRLGEMLAEALRIKRLYRAEMFLVHIGKKDREKEDTLNRLVAETGFDPGRTTILWEEGHPVKTLLQVSKREQIELLVFGALEREPMLKYYILGSVARKLIRKAKCSTMVITNPARTPEPSQRVVLGLSGQSPTPELVQAALFTVRVEGTASLAIVREAPEINFARMVDDETNEAEMKAIRQQFTDDNLKAIDRALEGFDVSGTELTRHVLTGRPGFLIGRYCRRIHADLLVVQAPRRKFGLLDRLFQHDIEFLLEDIPCNLMMIYPH